MASVIERRWATVEAKMKFRSKDWTSTSLLPHSSARVQKDRRIELGIPHTPHISSSPNIATGLTLRYCVELQAWCHF